MLSNKAPFKSSLFNTTLTDRSSYSLDETMAAVAWLVRNPRLGDIRTRTFFFKEASAFLTRQPHYVLLILVEDKVSVPWKVWKSTAKFVGNKNFRSEPQAVRILEILSAFATDRTVVDAERAFFDVGVDLEEREEVLPAGRKTDDALVRNAVAEAVRRVGHVFEHSEEDRGCQSKGRVDRVRAALRAVFRLEARRRAFAPKGFSLEEAEKKRLTTMRRNKIPPMMSSNAVIDVFDWVWEALFRGLEEAAAREERATRIDRCHAKKKAKEGTTGRVDEEGLEEAKRAGAKEEGAAAKKEENEETKETKRQQGDDAADKPSEETRDDGESDEGSQVEARRGRNERRWRVALKDAKFIYACRVGMSTEASTSNSYKLATAAVVRLLDRRAHDVAARQYSGRGFVDMDEYAMVDNLPRSRTVRVPDFAVDFTTGRGRKKRDTTDLLLEKTAALRASSELLEKWTSTKKGQKIVSIEYSHGVSPHPQGQRFEDYLEAEKNCLDCWGVEAKDRPFRDEGLAALPKNVPEKWWRSPPRTKSGGKEHDRKRKPASTGSEPSLPKKKKKKKKSESEKDDDDDDADDDDVVVDDDDSSRWRAIRHGRFEDLARGGPSRFKRCKTKYNGVHDLAVSRSDRATLIGPVHYREAARIVSCYRLCREVAELECVPRLSVAIDDRIPGHVSFVQEMVATREMDDDRLDRHEGDDERVASELSTREDGRKEDGAAAAEETTEADDGKNKDRFARSYPAPWITEEELEKKAGSDHGDRSWEATAERYVAGNELRAVNLLSEAGKLEALKAYMFRWIASMARNSPSKGKVDRVTKKFWLAEVGGFKEVATPDFANSHTLHWLFSHHQASAKVLHAYKEVVQRHRGELERWLLDMARSPKKKRSIIGILEDTGDAKLKADVVLGNVEEILRNLFARKKGEGGDEGDANGVIHGNGDGDENTGEKECERDRGENAGHFSADEVDRHRRERTRRNEQREKEKGATEEPKNEKESRPDSP